MHLKQHHRWAHLDNSVHIVIEAKSVRFFSTTSQTSFYLLNYYDRQSLIEPIYFWTRTKLSHIYL